MPLPTHNHRLSLDTLVDLFNNGDITEYQGVHIIHKDGSLDICFVYRPEIDGLWYKVKEYFGQYGITCTYSMDFQHQKTMKNFLAKFEIEEIFYQEWRKNDWIPSPLPEAYR